MKGDHVLFGILNLFYLCPFFPFCGQDLSWLVIIIFLKHSDKIVKHKKSALNKNLKFMKFTS